MRIMLEGENSDERKSGEELENEKPRDRRPRKKRRSRIISELRPVDGPGSALPSVPAIKDDDSHVSDDPLEAPDSGERAKEVFAAQRVRIKKSWGADLRVYMKNAHPFFGICVAHRHHPYKRGDRFLVLLAALLVAVLLCGIFAIRDCCTEVLKVPVNRRLALAQDAKSLIVEGFDERMECVAFYEDCSGRSAVCAHESTCRDSQSSNMAAQCVPDETPSQKCVVGSCPTGWTCNERTSECVPASDYVCYMPQKRTAVDAAIFFQTPRIAARKQQRLAPMSLLAISSSSSSDSASESSPSSGDSSHSSTSSSSSNSSSQSTSASSAVSETATVKVAMTAPLNGEVYSFSSTMLVEWHVTLLSGPDPGLDKFRVDFSADNSAFETIAANLSTPSSSSSNQGANATVYRFEWHLADNSSWLCTTCVLRICALDVASVADNSLCIRSDGKSASTQSSRRLQSTVEGSGSGDVTFRIVREAFECSCGLSHEAFVLAAVIIGVCIPVVVLLVEPLVSFYRDRQLFGLFTRRDGPSRPVIAGYTTQSATRKGRVVIIFVLMALCVACGFVAAQITSTNFVTERRAVVVLWVVTFAIAVALGVLVYCTLVWLVLFTVRWSCERARSRDSSGLSELRNSLLSDDVNAKNENVTSPMSTGWTVRGSEGEEYRMNT